MQSDMPPPETRRGWKMVSRCDCGPPLRPKSLGSAAGAAATLVIRPKGGDGAEGFTDMDMSEALKGPYV